jgi:hypothetical protein
MIDEDNFWSNWWNDIWQGKPKYSGKTYPSATLSTTIPEEDNLIIDGCEKIESHIERLVQD